MVLETQVLRRIGNKIYNNYCNNMLINMISKSFAVYLCKNSTKN